MYNFVDSGNAITTWNISGQDIPSLLADKNASMIGLEIGSDIGITAEHLLKNCPNTKLYCIDPYENYIDWNGNNLNDRTNVLSSFRKRMVEFGNRCHLIQKKTDDAMHLIDDDSLDFIFVDGLHTYDQVYRDCINYYPKLKTGGLFAGHDYTAIQAVRDAAIRFSEEIGKEILLGNNDIWYFYK